MVALAFHTRVGKLIMYVNLEAEGWVHGPQDSLLDSPLVIDHKSEKCGSYHVMMFRSCDDVHIM